MSKMYISNSANWNRIKKRLHDIGFVGYFSWLAVVATRKHLEDVRVYAIDTMRVVKFWLVEFGGHTVI